MDRKELTSITSVPEQGRHLLFIDEENDDLVLRDVTLRRCVFVRLGMKQAEFHGCAFLQSIFEDCYLRKASFINVDFTGSLFKDCNFERATFQSCSLRYARFQHCLLNVKEMLGSLPTEPNLRYQLLRSIIQNERDMGHKKVVDELTVAAIRTEKEELRNRVTARSSYYKNRYTVFGRFRSFIQLLILLLSDAMWGCGLKIRRLLISGASFIVLMAVVIKLFSLVYYPPGQWIPKVLSFPEAIYVSALRFATVGFGGYTPASWGSQVVSVLGSLSGAVFIGFLAASLYKRIAR